MGLSLRSLLEDAFSIERKRKLRRKEFNWKESFKYFETKGLKSEFRINSQSKLALPFKNKYFCLDGQNKQILIDSVSFECSNDQSIQNRHGMIVKKYFLMMEFGNTDDAKIEFDTVATFLKNL